MSLKRLEDLLIKMFDSKTDLCNIVLFKTDLCRGYSSDTAVYYKLWSSDLSIFFVHSQWKVTMV